MKEEVEEFYKETESFCQSGHGTEWDGCQSFYELRDLEKAPESVQGLREYRLDYRMNLVDVSRLQNMEVFESSLQYILSMVKYNKNKKLTADSLIGWKGERSCVFLTEERYKKSLECQEQGHIKIVSHAKVRNGHLHYDRQDQLQ